MKSDAHFTELMREISSSENRIAVARRDYNVAVRDYNVTVGTFPGNLVSGMMGYGEIPPFEADEKAHAVPEVSF